MGTIILYLLRSVEKQLNLYVSRSLNISYKDVIFLHNSKCEKLEHAGGITSLALRGQGHQVSVTLRLNAFIIYQFCSKEND